MTYHYLVDAVASSPNAVLISTNDASSLEVCLSPFAIVTLVVTPLAFEREPGLSIDRPNCVRHSNASRMIVAHRKWPHIPAICICRCHKVDARSPIPVKMTTLNHAVSYYHHPYRYNSWKIRYYFPNRGSNRLS